jgi:hypothetical protein
MRSQYKFVLTCSLLLGGVAMTVVGAMSGMMPLIVAGVVLIGVAGAISIAATMPARGIQYRPKVSSGRWDDNPLRIIV